MNIIGLIYRDLKDIKLLMKKKIKILITGGAGFVGTNLIKFF